MSPAATASPPTATGGARRDPDWRAAARVPGLPGRGGHRTRRLGVHLAVIACYALPAVALWWHAWDGHLASTLSCACGDAGQTVWFVAWPSYALSHGLDPFFSNAVQAPAGINLLANASAVPVGVLLTPLTLAAGPIVSTNVALTLCPALSAWACWIACRRFVSRPLAPAAAGALFGYSPFVVSNLALGHVGLSLLVCPPLAVVAGYEVLVGSPRRRVRWGVALGALVALQFFVSSEVLAVCVVIGVPAALVAAAVAARGGRLAPPMQILRAGAAGGAVLVIVLGWPLWFFLAGPQHLAGPVWAGASIQGNTLFGYWNPGAYHALGSGELRLGGYEGRRGPPSGYLGPVVLAASAVSLLLAWRRRAAWLLALCAVLAVVCSFGVVLWLSGGHADGIWLPWRVLRTWPLLDDVIPQRFSAVVDLCVALLVGIGLDRALALVSPAMSTASADAWRSTGWRAGSRRAVVLCVFLGGLVIAASPWWTYQVPFATRDVSIPRWFAHAATHLSPASVVLSVPFPFPTDGGSAPMVWQAVDDMGFRLAGSYAKAPNASGRPLASGVVPTPYRVLAALSSTAAGPRPRGTPRQVEELRGALRRWGVDDVVLTSAAAHVRRAVAIFTDVTGAAPRREQGAWVWVLRRTASRSRAAPAS